MDDRVFDRLTRRIAATSPRRSMLGSGLAAIGGALAAVSHAGLSAEARKKNKSKNKNKKDPRAPGCSGPAALCSTSDECCPSTTGRICAQNGCAIPDRPRCCAGVGQPCSGNSCECCGRDLDCVDRKCVYAPK